MQNKPFEKRKVPRQDRSRQTVNVILEATAHVLIRDGYEKTTTGAVAERAGVSIGSLYQYFPNKESLVVALIENHVAEVLALVDVALKNHADSPVEDVLRAIVRASLDAHGLQPALHRIFAEEVPRKGRLREALDISGKITALLVQHLSRRAAHLPEGRVKAMAFVLETVIEALTHQTVIHNPAYLTADGLEEEALLLLLPYMQGNMRTGLTA